jgi:hypothetical protein
LMEPGPVRERLEDALVVHRQHRPGQPLVPDGHLRLRLRRIPGRRFRVRVLTEAWDSGAGQWSAKEREAYANDLGDDRALIAVTARSNRSKADQDPATWLPPAEAYRCAYLADWVAVKMRWQLTVDDAERQALIDGMAGCPNEPVRVTFAR